MIGFAANDDAERDIGVIAPAFAGKGDRAGHFERAGHRDRLVPVPRFLDRGTRAGQQQVVQMLIKSRFDDQDAGHDFSPCWGGDGVPS